VPELRKHNWAENRYADFNLWASGIGAKTRGRASLDHRLSSHSGVRAVFLALLKHLSLALGRCNILGKESSFGYEERLMAHPLNTW
jgi:hypothetical protein